MPLTIPDEILRQSGLSEREMAIEIACRLFEAGTIYLPDACKLAGISRIELEEELRRRKIPVYRYTREMYEQDLETLSKLDAERAGRK
jgi:predicted HTH domain antitoxin